MIKNKLLAPSLLLICCVVSLSCSNLSAEELYYNYSPQENEQGWPNTGYPSQNQEENHYYSNEENGEPNQRQRKNFKPFSNERVKQAQTKHGGVYCQKTNKPVVFKKKLIN